MIGSKISRNFLIMQLMHGNSPHLYLSKKNNYMMTNLDDVTYNSSKHKNMVTKRNVLLPFKVRLK